MTDYELIKAEKQKALEALWAVEEILDKHLGHNQGQWHKVGEWDCKKSPVGLCVYHHFKDPAHDGCIYCHEPNERK